MQVSIADTYQEMSSAAAELIIKLLGDYNEPLICPASGHTPVELYRQLVQRLRGNTIVSRLSFIGLDEWVGMNGDDEGSCRHSLDRQLLQPLSIDNARISFFDGRDDDLQRQCQLAEEFLSRHRRINIAILGVGMNGHVGFNEPGVSAHYRTHVTELDAVTAEVGKKYFNTDKSLQKGITLGLSVLLESDHIILLASGTSKAEIVHQFVNGQVSGDLPVSYLKSHPSCRVFLDTGAAGLL